MTETQIEQLNEFLRVALDLPDEADVSSVARGKTPQWDSLAQVTLIAMIEDGFNVALSIDDRNRMTDYVGVVALLSGKLG